jgi:hypothetical protein
VELIGVYYFGICEIDCEVEAQRAVFMRDGSDSEFVI